MIGECLEQRARVRDRLALRRRAQGDRLRARASTAVLERLDDGRMNILVEGTQPVPAAAPDRRPALPGRRRGAARRRGRRRPRARPTTPAARYADLVERVTDERPDAESTRRARRLRDGRDARRAAGRQAGAARAALGARRAARAPGASLVRLRARSGSSSRRRRPSARAATAACAASSAVERRPRRRPPRRGSPAPVSSPVEGFRATACDPAEEQVALLPAADRPAASLQVSSAAGSMPGSASTSRPSTCRRGARPRPPPRARRRPRRGSSAGSPSGCGSSPPMPSASSGAPSRSTTVGAIMLGTRAPRRVAVVAERVQVLLAEHVVEVHAGAGHDHPGARAVRAGDRAQPPSASITEMCVVEPSRARTSCAADSSASSARKRSR